MDFSYSTELALGLISLSGALLVALGIQAANRQSDTDTAELETSEQPKRHKKVASAAPVDTAERTAAPVVDDVVEVDDVEVVEEPDVDEPDVEVVEEPEPEAPKDKIAAVKGRLARLRERLLKSNNAIGKGLLALLASDDITEDTWDEVEETLLMADLGMDATTELMDKLRDRVKVLGTKDDAAVKEMLAEELLAMVDPEMDRALVTAKPGRPAVTLVVGVNGAGKTTTVGKLARVFVAEDKDVLLGAADTFRAAAADQLQTWGDRVGVPVVRAEKDGGDPAAVAFDSVKEGRDGECDIVLIDTAGRLQNKKGLMDELSKIKRVAEKAMDEEDVIDEVLLVLDATTGQNGMRQAQVFAEAVDVTGVVLTKLDGTAKGGIVVAVQRELGVPVKLVGLGEGPDDLAPFDPQEFVDALLS